MQRQRQRRCHFVLFVSSSLLLPLPLLLQTVALQTLTALQQVLVRRVPSWLPWCPARWTARPQS